MSNNIYIYDDRLWVRKYKLCDNIIVIYLLGVCSALTEIACRKDHSRSPHKQRKVDYLLVQHLVQPRQMRSKKLRQ